MAQTITLNSSYVTKLIQKGRLVAKANFVLTPEFAAILGGVHGTYLKNNGIVVMARDYRFDSRMLKRAYSAGAMGTGIDLLDLKSSPLPLLQFCIRRFGASGGVYFSSGHSIHGETGIRIFDSGGVEFSFEQMKELIALFDQQPKRVDPTEVGHLSDIPHTVDIYSKAVPQFINKKKLSEAGLKLVLDCSYGPAGAITPPILGNLDVDVIALNTFAQYSMKRVVPSLDSIRNACEIVRASKADLGVVLDVDGTRSVIIDETGAAVRFEDLMMLYLLHDENLQKSKNSKVMTTYSCSKILDDFCESENFPLMRTENSPGNISRKIKEERACFGASDTMKFYFPQYGPFSDATFSLLKLLETLAVTEEPLSVLLRNLPKTIQAQKTVAVEPEIAKNLHEMLKAKLEEKKIDFIDDLFGIKILYDPRSWVYIVPSIHRDALNIISEAPDMKESQKLIELVEKFLEM